ncbi:MAG TPA: hypothetical protein VN783_01835 [Thermoanaerobaculia bacterium]|nr:hypothetical protein [Thermoanaerobaculia bacterium]
MSIEKFHETLQSAGDGGQLLSALRALNRIDLAQVQAAPAGDQPSNWASWEAEQT